MAGNPEKAALILHRKQALNGGLLMERKIWKVPKSEEYPDGIRYRLVLTDPREHTTTSRRGRTYIGVAKKDPTSFRVSRNS